MVTRQDRVPVRPTPWCSAPAATATSSTSRPTRRAATSRATWRAYKRGAAFANPCFTQIHPTCIPVSGRAPVEAHADERVAPQRRARLGAEAAGRHPRAGRDPGGGARLLPRAEVPELRQPGPARHRVAAPPRRSATRGAASGPAGAACTSTSPTRSRGWARTRSAERYGNLFEMYQRITDEDPYKVPMRIYPAVHYTMGGLWVDYNLMSTIPGLLRDRRGQLLRPRRQPARRERADAGAGRRLLRDPATPSATTSPRTKLAKVDTDHPESRAVVAQVNERVAAAAGRQRHAHGGLLPPRARQAAVGALRHGAQRRRAHGRRWRGSRSCARSSGRT